MGALTASVVDLPAAACGVGMAQDAQLPATPKERKAMRRAVPSAAVARAKSTVG